MDEILQARVQLEGILEKQSEKLKFFNERYVKLMTDVLFYYSEVPKNEMDKFKFQDLDPVQNGSDQIHNQTTNSSNISQSLQQQKQKQYKPKYGIRLNQIIDVVKMEDGKKKKEFEQMFQIKFKKGDLIDYKNRKIKNIQVLLQEQEDQAQLFKNSYRQQDDIKQEKSRKKEQENKNFKQKKEQKIVSQNHVNQRDQVLSWVFKCKSNIERNQWVMKILELKEQFQIVIPFRLYAQEIKEAEEREKQKQKEIEDKYLKNLKEDKQKKNKKQNEQFEDIDEEEEQLRAIEEFKNRYRKKKFEKSDQQTDNFGQDEEENDEEEEEEDEYDDNDMSQQITYYRKNDPLIQAGLHLTKQEKQNQSVNVGKQNQQSNNQQTQLAKNNKNNDFFKKQDQIMEVSNSDEFESGEEDSQEEETDVKTLKSSLTQNRKSFKSDFLGTLSLSKLKQEKEEFLEKQKQEEIQKRKQEEQEKKRQLKLERKQEEKEKQLEEQEIMLKQIEQAFEYRYQEFLTNYLVARHDKDENLKEGIKLVQLLGKFREFTEPIVKEIINDLINKQESRKYKPKQIETFKQNENFQINQSYYEIQKEYTNLLIKIRYIQEEKPVASRKQSDYNYLNQDSNLGYSQTLQNTINNKNGDIYENNIQNYNNFNINRNTSLESSIQNNKKNKNIIQNLNICNTLDFDDYHIKELSNEFKVLNVVNNKILEIRKKQQQQQQKYEQLMKLKNQYQNQADFFLRVPLTVYFEYKGFKIMVQTFCPKNDQVIFGPQIKKYNESNNNNFDEMNQNLKNNELNSKYTQKQKQQDFPLQENAQNFQFNKQEKQINFEREKSKSNFEYKYHPQIEKQMEIIAQKLNIMPHRVFFKNQILNIPLQLEVQVHQVEQFQDIQKLIKEYKQKQAKVQILQQELLESYSSSSQHDSSQSSSNSFDSSNCSSQLENEQKIFEIHANLALQDEVLTDENDKRKKKGGEFEKQNVDQFFRLRQIQEDLQDEASSEQDQVIYDEQTKFNQNYSKQYQAINLDKKSYYLYDLKNIFPQNFDIELFFNQEQNNMLNLSLASYHNLNQNQIQQQHQNLNLKNLNMYVQKLRPSFIFNQEFSLNPDFMYTISNDKELNESIQQFNSNNSEENYQNYVQELTGDNQNQNLKNQNYDHQKFVFQQIQQSQIEKMQLGVVCKQIRLQILNTFIYDLDNSIYIPISGYDLSHEIHRRGLNIKYLGIICKKCESIYVKKICRQEMIARCLKKVIQGKLTDYIINKEINSSKEEGKVDNNQVNQFRRNIQQFFEDKVLQNGNNKGEKEENEDELLLNFTRDEHKQIKEEKIQSMLVISIFNQIFGQNEGTLFIWNTLLPNLLKKYFYFEEQKIDLLEFELGGLLNSLVINLKLKFKYGVNIFNNVNQSLKNSITDYQIFNEKNLIDFNIQGQSYDMNAVDLVTMSERANQKIQNLVFSRNKRDLQIKREEKLSDKSKLQQEDYKLKKNQKSQEQKQQRKEIIQMLKIKIIIQNQLYGEKCLENLDTQVQLAQIYYEDQQIEEAKHNARIILEKYKDIPFIQMVYGYCILIRCSLSNEDFQAIQNYCQQALFNLGGNHPISLEIYNTMVQCCTKLADDEGIIFYLEKIEDCLKNSIGMNSEHYGDCILDIGDQLFKMGKFEEAVKSATQVL